MFKEFPGRHEIPAEIAAEGLRWFVLLASDLSASV
jgi:hypothetical protein